MASAAARKPAARTRQPAATRAARNAEALERARSAHTRTATKTKPRGAAAAPRRKSGAARSASTAPRIAPRPKPNPPHTAAPRVVAWPLARVAQGGASVVLDRLLRGRGWVVLVGGLLAGIVFLNVSVLELNRGIARTDARAAKLQRTNSEMREKVGRLDSAERIQRLAELRGYVLPQPGEVTYLRPDRARDGAVAVKRLEESAQAVAQAVPPVPAAAVPTAAPAAPPAPAPAPAPVPEPTAPTATAAPAADPTAATPTAP